LKVIALQGLDWQEPSVSPSATGGSELKGGRRTIRAFFGIRVSSSSTGGSELKVCLCSFDQLDELGVSPSATGGSELKGDAHIHLVVIAAGFTLGYQEGLN
jgi:hypothetical protein